MSSSPFSSLSSTPKKPSFQHALRDIPVPDLLHEGIPVLRVYANGNTTRTFLSLSNDKFTLFLKHTSATAKKKWFGSNKKLSDDDQDRVIDIGAISKIQRGHARLRNELAR
jgi:hypothetical protein